MLLGGLPALAKTYDLMSQKALADAIPAQSESGQRPAICFWGPTRYSVSVYAGVPCGVRFVPRYGGMEIMTRFLLQPNTYCVFDQEKDPRPLGALARRHKARVEVLGMTHDFWLLRLVRDPLN